MLKNKHDKTYTQTNVCVEEAPQTKSGKDMKLRFPLKYV